MQGKQMGVKVRDYCVLELTVIHAYLHKRLRVQAFTKGREMGGGGETWGSEQRMFHAWEYKHSSACALKRLGGEGCEVYCLLFGLRLPSPGKRPDSYLRSV